MSQKSNQKIRIGVIGTGNMGKNHVRILSEEPNFESVVIYDSQLEKTKELVNLYNVNVATSIESLLDQVDAVVIAAPSFLHKEIGLMAAQKKVHALVEKPLALNIKDAKELQQAFVDANRKLMVGHVERFNPTLTELIKILDDEKIIAVEIARYSHFDGRITDTDVIYDLMIHDIDIVCNTLCKKEVTDISGFGSIVKSKMVDFTNCLLKFEDGMLAKLSASRVTESKVRSIQVHTLHSYIIADLLNRSLTVMKNTNMVIENNRHLSYRQESISSKIFVPMHEPLRMELLSFYDCIVKDTKPAVDAAQAIRVLSIAEKLEDMCL